MHSCINIYWTPAMNIKVNKAWSLLSRSLHGYTDSTWFLQLFAIYFAKYIFLQCIHQQQNSDNFHANSYFSFGQNEDVRYL